MSRTRMEKRENVSSVGSIPKGKRPLGRSRLR